ncbi:glycosyl hydrolase-related protein [Jannaschia sp. S6380]|uniref:alpha-mannosidase n=1 Tax=Jannaschia sp. S6380 TaxID=2926408 RepID=UPI001FF69E66|nr:glycoside hydrolase family 38 C-terminal domain-containing protein [Jannaschia sp. S6380]MCK0166713.1 glycosyl hydrolase-related protein [Jannaschia sp. S6380]
MNHGQRFTAEKIGKRLALIRPLIHRARADLPPFRLEVLEACDAPVGSGDDRGEIAWNSYWAGQDTHFVLRTSATVPEHFAHPALHLPMGVAGDIFTHPEALVRLDGEILGSADRYHHSLPLDPSLADGAVRELRLCGWTGLAGWPPDPADPVRLLIRPCAVVDIDRRLQAFVALADVALDVAQTTDNADTGVRLLDALDAAFLVLDTRDPLGDALRATVPDAMTRLSEGIAAAGAPLDTRLHAIGHAHMDIAYLWPISQIRQKSARTTSNVLRLMDRHADFLFSHSQPQLYSWLETDFPDLFARVAERVAEGRWEVMGGMWVEPDCNMPGAEALVRQILLGRSYFRESFGDVETPVLWLPDTFGFPWSLPQLMAQSGLTSFVTNKLNWNQTNRMPSSTTWWQGIDGTRVLAHFLTTPREVQHLPFPTNYKSDLSAAEVIGTWTNATTEGRIRDLPIAYGYGNGGGGPTEELIEKAKAFEAMPGAPRVAFATVRAAMETIRADAENLPIWNGEFYLEGHRGVLTSQGWIKRANRRAEALLHATEAALVTAHPGGVGADVRAELTDLWRMLCTNQFHDVLTGTSIGAVFEDARRDFAAITSRATALRDAALTQLFPSGDDAVFFNPAPVMTAGPALLPDGKDGQGVEGGTLLWVDLPAYGGGGPSCPADAVRLDRGDAIILQNGQIECRFSLEGQLESVTDKRTGRELLAPGEDGNQLWAFEDRPVSWDAWDIDPFFEDRAERIGPPESVEVAETGPLRAAIHLTWRWRNSRIVQHVRLAAGSPRLDFVTEVDWHEQHTLFKVAFPVDVLSPRATYEIQWGEIERPTHRNTSWDAARFEVPAQRWAELGEGGFGVALLNDCKHGYDIHGNVMRLSLIKSATSPDPQADQGRHVLTYAVMAHSGDLYRVRDEARRLGHPPIAIPGRQPGGVRPLVSCVSTNVVLETLKPAEDGDGFILRLYEAGRRRGPVTISFSQTMEEVHRCDLLERDGERVRHACRECTLNLAPFEIVSLRCRPVRA